MNGHISDVQGLISEVTANLIVILALLLNQLHC